MLTTQIETLKAHYALLPSGQQSFALSLASQFSKKGYLSDKQVFWADKLCGMITNVQSGAPATPEMKATEVGSLAGLKSLFAVAKQHVASPAIVLTVKNIGDIRLNIAGNRAQKPGSINVVNDGAGIWYGRVDGATYEASRKTETPAPVITMLQEMSVDPVGTAKAHATLTGRCCFCNAHLSLGKSTEVGYGEKCARNYGMPWGAKKFQFSAEAVA